ncbi:8288_t:CDS:2 [Entrophospora sp. SA101]|nr:8288_t:CDS:2 [Entrophospora sp. SA101]
MCSDASLNMPRPEILANAINQVNNNKGKTPMCYYQYNEYLVVENQEDEVEVQDINFRRGTSETDTIESEILTFDYGSIEQQIRQECDVKVYVKLKLCILLIKYQLRLIRDLKNDHKKHTWNDTTEISALASIIILDWPCRYDTFTSKEWELVTNDNPYKLTRPIFDEQLSSSLNDALIK